MKRIYRTFYLQGRDEIHQEGIDLKIDLVPLAQDVLDGKDMHEVCMTSAKLVISPLVQSERRKWLENNEDEIETAGGDKELAWTQFNVGRMDEVRNLLEENVIETMNEELEIEEDDDKENGDDEDDEEDEEGDNDEEEGE